MSILSFVKDLLFLGMARNLLKSSRGRQATHRAPVPAVPDYDTCDSCDYDHTDCTCADIDSIQDRIDELEGMLDTCDPASDRYDLIQDEIDRLQDRVDDAELSDLYDDDLLSDDLDLYDYEAHDDYDACLYDDFDDHDDLY